MNEQAETAAAMDDLIEALLDRGVITPEDLPDRLHRLMGRRRLLMHKLGMTQPKPERPNG